MNTRSIRLVTHYKQIKKLHKKYKCNKEDLYDEDDIVFDDDEYNNFFSKSSSVIRKWNTPKKNEYFKEKLKHDLLPYNKLDDDEYKDLLIEILRLENARERYIHQLSMLGSNKRASSSTKISQKRKLENIKFESSLNCLSSQENVVFKKKKKS